MLNLRRVVSIVLSVTVLLALTEGVRADAKSSLRDGVKAYNDKNYKAAKATLEKIDPADLPEASRQTLSSYLDRATTGVAKQTEATDALKAAQAAMKAGKFSEAKAGFKLAAESEYLQPEQKDAAKAQLAVAEAKEKDLAAKPKAETEPKLSDEAKAVVEKAVKAIADAKALVEKGNHQYAAKDYDGAKASFNAALTLDPGNPEAKDGLAKVTGSTDSAVDNAILDRVQERMRLRKQMAEHNFDKHMSESLRQYELKNSAADFENAKNSANMAADVIQRDKTAFSDAEFDAKMAQVKSRLEQIADGLAAWQRQDTAQRQADMIAAEAKRRERVEAEKERKVEILTQRARALIDQHKYALAHENVEQILAIEPANNWALARRDLLADSMILMRHKDVVRTQVREQRKTLVGLRETEIPWYELLRYPEDWKELTVSRRQYAVGTAAESEENRAVRLRFRQKLPKLEFAGVPFEMVIQFLREVSNISIYVNWGKLQDASVDKSTEVNVHLVDVTFERALRVILADVSGTNVGTEQEVAHIIEDGIVKITTKEALNLKVSTIVYDIRDLIVPMPNVGVPETIGLSSTSSDSGGSGDSGGLFDGGDSDTGDNESVVQSQQELVESVVELIRETIAPDSWDAGAAAIRPLGGQLVVTQTDENHGQLLNLINQLREARTMQISVEARFITVSTGFLNTIGLDLDVYLNLYSTVGNTAGSTVAGGQVPLNQPSAWTTAGWKSTQARSLSPVGIVGNHDYINTLGPGISEEIGDPTMTISGTFLDDVQVNFLLTATQAHSSTRTLNAPRITLLNGTGASIQVGSIRAYVASVESDRETDDAGFTTITRTYEVEYFELGTQLYVRGTISADRRYVTMTIVPTLTSLTALRWFPGEPEDFIAGGWSGDFIQLPDLSIATLTTVVSVPDGGTLLLGGLKETGDYEREQGVPLLSKIPFLNRLVTNRGMARDERTLLILVKPKIIIQREEEDSRF